MKKLVQCSRNICALFVDGDGAEKDRVIMIPEIVLVTIDQEYKFQLRPPIVEGGAPQFGIAKVPVAETVRFHADKSALQMLLVSISNLIEELAFHDGSDGSVDEDKQEPRPTGEFAGKIVLP